ncbi:MAG TPA: hypothetical protein VGB30_14840 [bacterium]|jgi:hypothetical protein
MDDEFKNNGGSTTTDSDLFLVRALDSTILNHYPDGVSLMRKVEGGKVHELHKIIKEPLNPHAVANSEELTGYLWSTGKSVTLEPGGGITVRCSRSGEKFVLGRAFFRDSEIEYRMLHKMIVEALG